ncbi:hypothetical protein DICPUDRAFT_27081 [Dictyostelium purpureum]|uniref:DNA-directed DNA polymerase n=1 Tax=Dictyostelium purpureum TaxID=5786 RepID=F0Z9M2_DICPU|nr:uncharacterized protein DICPUDRAFT_27081 [Dictyostelium purpureum]EGC39324.1 hypothetical protein DICPUDRAFT_27081 [Dictyostelium purpureum]|eukprot:XP_003284112.1 hypothetical protein DICPUDRAFT_27081 [Dictyostelium purpureum]
MNKQKQQISTAPQPLQNKKLPIQTIPQNPSLIPQQQKNLNPAPTAKPIPQPIVKPVSSPPKPQLPSPPKQQPALPPLKQPVLSLPKQQHPSPPKQQQSPPKQQISPKQQPIISPPKQHPSPPKQQPQNIKIITKDHVSPQLGGYKPYGGVTLIKNPINNINRINSINSVNNVNVNSINNVNVNSVNSFSNSTNNNNTNNIKSNVLNFKNNSLLTKPPDHSINNNNVNNNSNNGNNINDNDSNIDNNRITYNSILQEIDIEDFDISTSQFVCGISQDIKKEIGDSKNDEEITEKDLEEAVAHSQSFLDELNYNLRLTSKKQQDLEESFNNPQYSEFKSTSLATHTTKTTSNDSPINTKTTDTKSYVNNTKKIIHYTLPTIDKNLVSNDITECCEKIFKLPKTVGDIYKRKGLRNLYDWQKECLSSDDLLLGKNLVYSLPTSGGKTMVAEIILFRNLLIRKKKSLFIFPFVSIVTERVQAMSEFASALSFQVEGYFGCNGTMPVVPGPRMLISTIEKANIIVNQLIEDGSLLDIGCVVVDELHMIGDGDRGELLEILISKLLFMSKGEIQIVGMSATIPNIQNLKNWIRGGVYEGNFRPVPLTEYIKIGNNLYDKDNNLVKTLESPNDKESHTLELISEIIPKHSVLVFCPSKAMTFNLATSLATKFPENILQDKRDQRETLIQLLKSSNGSKIDEELKKMILAGVAYHNSDLTNDEREVIEKGFKERSLLVLCATSTLSTGVNLPARRVILRSPTMGRDLIGNRVYRQMVGRAGRAGIDDFGESILMCEPHQAEKCKKLLNSPLDPLISCIKSAQSFQKIVLDSICSGIGDSRFSILHFLSFTYYITHIKPPKGMKPYEYMEGLVKTGIETLLKEGYIQEIKFDENKKMYKNATLDLNNRPTEDSIRYEATGFGFACFRSCLNIKESKLVHAELQKAYQGSVVISEPLHMCYITTPFFNIPEVTDWNHYINLFREILKKPSKARVANVIGISEEYMIQRLNGFEATEFKEELKYKRFYIAMVLYDLVHEQQLYMAANKFKLHRGSVQTLMQQAGSFSWMVSLFCKKLGWIELEHLVNLYTQRLDKGVKSEIIPLVEINGVKQARARALWNAGFKTVKSIAVCPPDELARKVNLGKFGEGQARNIIREAGKLLEKKAEEFRAKAKEFELISNPN